MSLVRQQQIADLANESSKSRRFGATAQSTAAPDAESFFGPWQFEGSDQAGTILAIFEDQSTVVSPGDRGCDAQPEAPGRGRIGAGALRIQPRQFRVRKASAPIDDFDPYPDT